MKLIKNRPLASLSFFIALITFTSPLLFAPEIEKSYHKKTSTKSSTLRFGTDLCNEELYTLQNRQQKIHECLQTFIGQTVDQKKLPTIGIVCSGGGLRASTSTLGLLKGLKAIGLLDATSYIAALSGSTWTTAAWMYHNIGLDDLERHLQPKLRHALMPNKINSKALFTYLYKLFFKTKKHVTLNDMWGAILGNIFLEKPDNTYGQKAHLHDIREAVMRGDYPIPLFTAIHGEASHQWAEFSPFEIGSTHLGVWTSPENFGETFGYLLGLWGSAFSFNGYDVAHKIGHLLPSWFAKLLTSSWLKDTRVSIPTVKNFTHGIEKSPYKNNKHLTFSDAGIAFNLPFPPLLRRKVDIYIVSDACFMIGEKEIGHSLRDVEKYAKENGYLFPTINYEKAKTQKVSIFSSKENPKTPVVIYIPNFHNLSTLDFNYSKKKFLRVVGDITNAITSHAQLIRKTVIKKARQKQRAF